jgi:hypothetical protein
LAQAWRTASSKPGVFTINDVEVTVPARCASTMPRVTPAVKPKSSELMMRRRLYGTNR